MKNQKEVICKKLKKKYVKPEVIQIVIDHEISLVMMSESPTPPPENIGIRFNPLKFLK
jgi:hypothetical protein